MTYASEVAADSPVLWWRFNETSGTTANDSSGNGRHGTYVGSPTLGAAGLITDGTTAVQFTGSNHVAYSGTVLTSSAMTIEAWVSSSTLGRPFATSGTSSECYLTPQSSTSVNWRTNASGTGVGSTSSTASVADGNRHHIVITHTGGTGRLYVDGSFVASVSAAGTMNVSTVVVGADIAGSGFFYTGTIDEFAIYSAALSDARIAAHYAAGVAIGTNEIVIDADLPSVVGALAVETGRVARIDADLPAVTGSLALETSRVVSIDAEVPAIVGGLVLDNLDTTAVRIDATIPSVVSDVTIRAGTTTQVNRTGAWVRDNIGEAIWSPTVVAPAVAQPEHRVVAQSYAPPVIDGTQLILTPTLFDEPAHRSRLVVGGVDVTYFRGAPTPIPDYQWVQPLGYGAATFTLPQAVVPFEMPGEGALAWCRKGAPVLVQRVDTETGTVVATDYRGLVIAHDLDGGVLRIECGGHATGRAALQDRQMALIQKRVDAGTLVASAIRQLRVRHEPHAGTATGISLIRWGGGNHLDFINELVSKMTTADGDQWTVMPHQDGTTYRTTLRDTTTIHGTVYLDDSRVKGDLRSDLAEEPNRVFASGVAPDGMVVKFGAYPGLIQSPAPPYPFDDNSNFGVGTTDEDTDTGDGITVMGWRLRTAGYLDAADGYLYNSDMVAAIIALKRDAKIQPYNGNMNPTTWSALFDLSATGFNLRDIRVMPAAANDNVVAYRYSANGSVIAENPDYDPSVVLVDRTIAMGAGFTRSQIRRWARKELATAPAWRGTIEINTGAIVAGDHAPGDPISSILRARDIRPGMNLSLPLFAGGIVVHVAGVSVSAIGTDGANHSTEGKVTLAVDTKPGDTLPVWAAIQRDRENRDTVHRSFMRQHRASRLERENTFDEVGGVVSPIALNEGWNVFPVVAKQAGTIERLRMQLSPAREFAVAVFGRRITRKALRAVTNAPLTEAGSKRWTSEAMHNRLDSKYVMLYVAGSEFDPCGYSPGRKSEGASLLTGKFDDDASFPFVTYVNDTDRGSVLWVAVWVPSATTLRGGRIMWPSAEDY